MTSAPLSDSENILRNSKQLVHAVILEDVDSTDTLARRLITELSMEDEGLPPTMILAKRQRQGRGRRGHRWMSPAGGLYLNYLRSGFSENELQSISLCAATALCSLLESLGTPHIGIKWPNDILLDGGKLAGFLCYILRREEYYASIGLGLNLLQAPDPGSGASFPSRCLRDVLPEHQLDPLSLALDFIDAFESAVTKLKQSRDAWRSHLIHREGERMRVVLEEGQELNGEFVGVNPDGHLLLRVGEKIRTLSSAEVFPS